MSMYEIYMGIPLELHPEREKEVLTDNCGKLYYVNKSCDGYDDLDEVIECFATKQEAWQEVFNRFDSHIKDLQDSRARCLAHAIQHGYTPKEI